LYAISRDKAADCYAATKSKSKLKLKLKKNSIDEIKLSLKL
jgi:hypothetical protein